MSAFSSTCDLLEKKRLYGVSRPRWWWWTGGKERRRRFQWPWKEERERESGALLKGRLLCTGCGAARSRQASCSRRPTDISRQLDGAKSALSLSLSSCQRCAALNNFVHQKSDEWWSCTYLLFKNFACRVTEYLQFIYIF